MSNKDYAFVFGDAIVVGALKVPAYDFGNAVVFCDDKKEQQMKVKPFYIRFKNVRSADEVKSVFDKCIEAGASIGESDSGYYSNITARNKEYSFGVKDNRCYFLLATASDSVCAIEFGPDAIELTPDKVDAHLGLTKWNGDGDPPVGEEVVAIACNGSHYVGVVLCVEPDVIIVRDSDGEVRVLHRSSFEFHPAKPDEERARDEAIEAMAANSNYMEAEGRINGVSLGAIYDAIADGEIPGVKLESNDE